MSLFALGLLLVSALSALWFLVIFYSEVRGKRAEGTAKVALILSALYTITHVTNPTLIHEGLHERVVLSWGALMALLFTQELKRTLDRIGDRLSFSLLSAQAPLNANVADALYEALTSLAQEEVGALIVVRQRADLRPFLSDGVSLDAQVSAPLLKAIFYGKNPLHDGAVVIEDQRITFASTFLPMSAQPHLIDQSLGTRHRAAIGLSEETDALVLVVSEERGTISFVYAGQLHKDIPPDELKQTLTRFSQVSSLRELI